MGELIVRLRSRNASTMRPRATPPTRMSVALTLLTEEGCNEIGVTGKGCWRPPSSLDVPWQPQIIHCLCQQEKPRALLCPVFFSDGWLVTDYEEMARELNNYNRNVFTVEDIDNIPELVIIHSSKNMLTDIDCAEPEIEAKLKELKHYKAPASDGFFAKGLAPLPDLQQIFDPWTWPPTQEKSLSLSSRPGWSI